jgi:ubiquinone biosynthesis protein
VATRPKQRNLGRLSEIAQVAVRHGFGYAIEGRRAHDPSVEGTARGRHLREMLDELGPTFVKFGQLLSTRPDIVPPDIIAELRSLQDDVRPFPFADVRRTIEEELGQTLERLFIDFDEQPLAAASIGQVHRATLPNGKRVAVKVQRPNAPRQIEADLALMYQAARLAKERVRATRTRSSTSSRVRSARSSTTGSRAGMPTRFTTTSPDIRMLRSRRSTGRTRARAS